MSTNHLVYWLQKVEPERLDDMRTEYPSEAALKGGILLGEAAPEAIKTHGATQVRRTLARAVCRSMEDRCSRLLPIVQKRLIAAERWEHAGELLTLVSSGGLFGLLLSGDPSLLGVPATLTAAVTLICSAISLFARRKKKSPMGGELTTQKLLERIIVTKARSEQLVQQLRIWGEDYQEDPASGSAKLDELLNEANDLAGKIGDAIFRLREFPALLA